MSDDTTEPVLELGDWIHVKVNGEVARYQITVANWAEVRAVSKD